MRVSWLAVRDPFGEVSRMGTWLGETERVVVTGVPLAFWRNAPMDFEHESAVIHSVPAGLEPMDLAAELDGVVVTRFRGK